MSQQKGDITIWAIVGIVVLIAVVVGLAKLASGPGADTATLPTRTIDRGLTTSTVTLVEYGDFQCPACKLVLPTTELLFKEYGDRVHFVWRHFPLRNLHKNAEPAARASEAAWKQGKFWEMYEKLYAGQEDWSGLSNASEKFEQYAEEIGLNLATYTQDVMSTETRLAVNADANEARLKKVPGTPAFSLNGEMIKPASLEEFRQLLDTALGVTSIEASSTLQLSPLPPVVQ